MYSLRSASIRVAGLTGGLVLSFSALGCGSSESGGGTPPPDGKDNDVDVAWTWTPVDGAICGNGSATGIGIRKNPASKKLVIYLEAGGACFSKDTCIGANASAAHFEGYGTPEFEEFK